MSYSTPLACVLVLAAAVAGPVCAEPLGSQGRIVVQVRVPVGDLDLTQPAGADELLRRVRVAARRACGGDAALTPLLPHDSRSSRDCATKALGQAVASLAAPLVRQRYAQQAGTPPVLVAEGAP